MTSAIPRKMNSIQISSSILVLLISLSEAIRVDWNTNTGPIVPPIPTQPPRPQLPYRDPAPVWEDQSDDIPNPNQYRYILPPPSRPRPPVDNYLRAPIYSQNLPNQQQQPQTPNYGQVLTNSINNYQNNIVPSLGVQYIPNVGPKYSAIVPQKSYYLQQNDIYDHKYEKPSGRYNAKLKKYKAYEEKLKYYPHDYVQQANQYQFAIEPQQQLPILQAPQPFRQQNFNQQQLPLQENPVPFNSQPNKVNSQQQQQSNVKRESQQFQTQQWNQQNWQQEQQPFKSQYERNIAQTGPQLFSNPTQQTETTTTAAATSIQNQPQNLGNNNKQS